MLIDKIAGAVFDMDGTLIDSLIVWEVIWEKLGVMFRGETGFRPSSDDDRAVRTMTLVSAMEFINERYRLADSGALVFDAVNDIIADFYANEVLLKEGVIELLEYLRSRGVKMCIASATDKALLALAIEHCGLGEYFECVLSCADLGKGKDCPDIYRASLDSLGTSVGDTCVFEDSLVALRTAKSIGLMTVGIFDKCNFGHDEIPAVSDVYVGEGERLDVVLGVRDN